MIQKILSVAGRVAVVTIAGGVLTTIASSRLPVNPPHESAPAKPAAPGHSPAASPSHDSTPAKGFATPPAPSSKPKGDKKSAGSGDGSDATKTGAAGPGTTGKSSVPSAQPTSDEALKLLQEGNERWLKSTVEDPNIESSRRKMLADEGQKPFAAVLTCADSRIPVERVFDRGVGDVFVMRVAGNVAGPHEAGSIEYAAEHLHVPLLVVMGHTKCGAVGAAAAHAKLEGNVPSLITAIEPAVERAKKLNPAADDKQVVTMAVSENVWQTIFDLIKSSGPIREMVSKGELKVVGAVYDIADGKVQWLGEHPWQSELVVAFSKEDGHSGTHAEASSEAHPQAQAEEHK